MGQVPENAARVKRHEELPEGDLALVEKLREGAPELAESLEAFLKNADKRGARAGSMESFLSGLFREANAALTEEKADLAIVLATPHEEAVLIMNNSGIITGVCKHSGEILGRKDEDLIGLPIDSILTERFKGIEASTAEMAKAAKGKRVHSKRTQERSDGTTFESIHTVVALIGRYGETSGFARSIEDISERRLHEIHIKELNASIAILMHRKDAV